MVLEFPSFPICDRPWVGTGTSNWAQQWKFHRNRWSSFREIVDWIFATGRPRTPTEVSNRKLNKKYPSCCNFYLKFGIQTFWRVVIFSVSVYNTGTGRIKSMLYSDLPPFKMFVYQISGKNSNEKGTFYSIFYYSLPREAL